MMWISLLVVLLGVCFGSFLNVVIFRTNEEIPMVKGRSTCRTCEEPIDARDLVPILSYILLKGRCRKCKAVVSWQYPAVELATGVLFLLAFLSSALTIESPMEQYLLLLRNWVFVSYLVIIFVYDLRHMLILDKFTIPAMIIAILANLWLGVVPVWSILVGALVIAGFFWIQFSISRGTWVGGGDIRMGALMGFMLGLEYGLVALFFSYLLGAIAGVFLLASGRADRKTPIPFGTFMAIATLLTLFAGPTIVHWYLGFFL